MTDAEKLDRYEAALRHIGSCRCRVALEMGMPYPERAPDCSCDSCIAREALAAGPTIVTSENLGDLLIESAKEAVAIKKARDANREAE
jgi:hypothetical protein